MIIKNSLDTELFLDDDTVILPGKEYECKLVEPNKLKLTSIYGIVHIWLSSTATDGIEITCTGIYLVAIHGFLKDKNRARRIEICKRKLCESDIDSGSYLQDVDNMYENSGLNNKYEKPPLGCATFDMIAGDRIHELSSAIDRYSSESKDNIDLIRKWAKEIILQCDLIDKMKDVR